MLIDIKKLKILTNFSKKTLYLNDTQLEDTFVLHHQRHQQKQLSMKCTTSFDVRLDMPSAIRYITKF